MVRLAQPPVPRPAPSSWCWAALPSRWAPGWRWSASASGSDTTFRLAGCLLLPLAVLSYPRLAWRDPLSFLLLVVVVGAGVLGVAWVGALVAMGYVDRRSPCCCTPGGRSSSSDAEARRALTWSSLAWIGAGLVAAFLGFLSESADVAGVPGPQLRSTSRAWPSAPSPWPSASSAPTSSTSEAWSRGRWWPRRS